MSAAGSKVETRSPDASAALDLMESLCPCPADAHKKKFRASAAMGCIHRKLELMLPHMDILGLVALSW